MDGFPLVASFGLISSASRASRRGVTFTWSPALVVPPPLPSVFRYRSLALAKTEMATLVLEDGTTFKGRLFGAGVSVSGEVGESVHF